MQLTTVIFDLGGVVLDWQPERAFEQVMPAADVPGFLERVGFAAWNRANDLRARIGDAEDELVRRFPADEDGIRGYRRHFLHSVTGMVPGTAAVIAELAGSGVRLGALTNWVEETFLLTRDRFGVLDRFADIVVSGSEGIAKPDPAIFRLACERMGVEPEEAVFIDDAPANVEAATALGMTGLRFTDAGHLRSDLLGLGLLGEPAAVTGPVFHLTLRDLWDAALAAGEYPWSTSGVSYEREGFVHCSFANQVEETRRRVHPGVADDGLALLEFDASALPVVVENGYPHLFAPLPVDRVRVVRPRGDGGPS
ncbi:MAG: HAD-IA family hydrolase [Propionicimonas sp.]|uniref:HAD-IA family hydrolase n=1 Tax=Propionicimonas sp. TaxID=1955623 RepID=UPI003D0EBEAB